MPEDDQPSPRIWLNPEALNSHFESLVAKSKARASGMEMIGDGDTMQSEFSKQLRK